MATQLKPKEEYSKEEWQARLDLAACYRIFDHLGWSESIYNHISVAVPDRGRRVPDQSVRSSL